MGTRIGISRRGALGTLGALGAAAAVATTGNSRAYAAPVHAAPAHAGSWAARAVDAWLALQHYFAAPDGSGLYREHYPVTSSDRAYSYEWPFSQAHGAALDLTGMAGAGRGYLPALAQQTRAQLHYFRQQGSTGLPGFASYPTAPFGGGGDFFYDDNEWVGLIDVQHWLAYHDSASLQQAEMIFDLVVSGWDDDPQHAAPGGVFWTQASWSSDRNTVSNMPGAELGLRLYQITGRRHYLDWAMRMYQWTNTYLQREDGLYNDHLSLDGAVETTVWSYNQGVPIGVNTLLAEVTGQRRYLDEARRIAAAAHAYYGTGGRLDGQPVYFNSIYFKNLLLAQSRIKGHHYVMWMRDYAERLYRLNRDPATGLFGFSNDGATQMIEQAAVVQIFAVLAWPTAEYANLY